MAEIATMVTDACLRTVLSQSHGILSRDRFERSFTALDQAARERRAADPHLALLRRIALSPLKCDPATKSSIEAKRFRAACDDACLRSLPRPTDCQRTSWTNVRD